MSEGTNGHMPARKTLVQLLALYTNPESRSAQRYTDSQTDGRHDDANRYDGNVKEHDCLSKRTWSLIGGRCTTVLTV